MHALNHPIPSDSPVIAGCPSSHDSVTTSMLLSRLSSLHSCPGNPEPKFVSLASMKRNGKFLSSNSEVVAYLDSGGSVMANGECYASTVRTVMRHLLTDANATERITLLNIPV